MHWSRPVLVVGIAVVATAAAAVLLRPWVDDEPPPAAPASTSERASGLTTLVSRTEERVARVPGDWRAWADLGMARIQLARISGDPAQYPRAEEALRTSLDLRADGNAPALTGMAALAAARHDFGDAEGLSRQPGDAGLLFGRARLAYARGDDAAAIADARAAVKAAPTPEHATALGDLLTAGGDEAGARADLTEALRINPRFSPRDVPAARAALAELGA